MCTKYFSAENVFEAAISLGLQPLRVRNGDWWQVEQGDTLYWFSYIRNRNPHWRVTKEEVFGKYYSVYQIYLRSDEDMTCTCQGFQRSRNSICKHIQMLVALRQQHEV